MTVDDPTIEDEEPEEIGQPETRIYFEGCYYRGSLLDSEGFGDGDLNYYDGRTFTGTIKEGKPYNGFMTTLHQDGSEICEYKDSKPFQGVILNSEKKWVKYQDGRVQESSRTRKAHKWWELGVGTSLAASMGFLLYNHEPDQAPQPNQTQQIEHKETPVQTEESPIMHSAQLDDYIPDGKTKSELLAEYGDLTKTCTPEELNKINWAKEWLQENVDVIDGRIDTIRTSKERAWMNRLIVMNVAFPEDKFSRTNEIFKSKEAFNFKCPGPSEKNLGLSRFDEVGSIALYEGAFWDRCTLVNTLLHEALHENAHWSHPHDAEYTGADWIFYAGETAEDYCRESLSRKKRK